MYKSKFMCCSTYVLLFSSVFVIGSYSNIQINTEKLVQRLSTQLNSVAFDNQLTNVRFLDEIQDRTLTLEEAQSALSGVNNQSSSHGKVLCADILSNLCWNQTLRKNLADTNFPLQSFDVSEIRSAAINLYEESLKDIEPEHRGMINLRLANSYTGLASLQNETLEKTATRSTAFQYYLSAYEDTNSSSDVKINALRGAVNTLDALQKLDERYPVAQDRTVFALVTDQINRIRSVVEQLLLQPTLSLDNLKTISSFANAIWVIGDSETAKKRNSTLPSVQEAYKESIHYYQQIVNQTSLDRVSQIVSGSTRMDWCKLGLDARIWLYNIKQDIGYVKLKTVSKEELIVLDNNLYTFAQFVEADNQIHNQEIKTSLDLANLLKCEFHYVMKEFQTSIDYVDQCFGDTFSSLRIDDAETKSTQIVTFAQHFKILSLYNLGEFEKLHDLSVQLISLKNKHIFPNASKNYWAERQKFYSWALNGLGRDDEAFEYRATLGEMYPEIFPEYIGDARLSNIIKTFHDRKRN